MKLVKHVRLVNQSSLGFQTRERFFFTAFTSFTNFMLSV